MKQGGFWKAKRATTPRGVVFLCRLTHRNVAGGAGDPLFGDEEAEGQNQEFALQFAAVARRRPEQGLSL